MQGDGESELGWIGLGSAGVGEIELAWAGLGWLELDWVGLGWGGLNSAETSSVRAMSSLKQRKGHRQGHGQKCTQSKEERTALH